MTLRDTMPAAVPLRMPVDSSGVRASAVTKPLLASAIARTRRTSVAALDANAGICERRSQLHFDARRFTSFDVLKVKRRTGQHFDAALQHTARGADTGLVLIEALRGRISAHADVHAVVIAAPIGIVQQDEIEVRAAAAASR